MREREFKAYLETRYSNEEYHTDSSKVTQRKADELIEGGLDNFFADDINRIITAGTVR